MVSKFASFFVFNDTVKNIVDELDGLWMAANQNGSPVWLEIAKKHKQLSRRNTKIVIGIYFIAACSASLLPFIICLAQLIIFRTPGDSFPLGLHVE